MIPSAFALAEEPIAERRFCHVRRGGFASAPEMVEQARRGRMLVLVDSAEAGGGALLAPAQAATPEIINFMATHGRGLVSLAVTQERATRLGFAPMPRRGEAGRRTGSTVSIEARQGVTTGISAADRARTIRVAVHEASTSDDLVSPGHVFPLVAADGGVLARAGYAEAAVDLARLAGHTAAGVICEIMNDGGALADRDELVAFAREHCLALGFVADLVAFRRRHDPIVRKVDETIFESAYGGEWRVRTYANALDGAEHVALIKGDLGGDQPTLVRMHALSLIDDCLGGLNGRGRLLNASMSAIGEEGRGVVVIVGGAAGPLRKRATASPPASDVLLREYGIAAQVLADLALRELILLTNSGRHRLVGLEGYGFTVVEERPILTGQPDASASAQMLWT